MPTINRDGVEIYYEVHGSGPPLLLTHGYSSTSQMWQGQIEALSKHHKLVLWDMRGHGRSDYRRWWWSAPTMRRSSPPPITWRRKVVIPAAGHAVNIDQPQAFIAAVLPFLDGLAGGALP